MSPQPGSNAAVAGSLLSAIRGNALAPGWWACLAAAVAAGFAAFDVISGALVRSVIYGVSVALVALYVHECQATKRQTTAASAMVTAARIERGQQT